MDCAIYKTLYISPLGEIILHTDGENLTALYFNESGEKSPRFCESQNLTQNLARNSQNLAIFAETKKWLDLYFSGEIPQWTPKIAFPSNASVFALRVWEILQSVPYGKTTTYGAIAKQIAREFGIAKMPAQAVGGALSRNPIAIIIPCHRVIGANNIGGYNGGIAHKLALLKIEGITTNHLKMPKN